MVYLAKYLCWINGSKEDPQNVDFLIRVALLETEDVQTMDLPLVIEGITRVFDTYADGVDKIATEDKRQFVQDLLMRVTPIARDVWVSEQDEYRGADVD